MHYILKNNIFFLPDKTVIKAKADIAPTKTISLGCLIAIIAAMKNVLSPISETRMTLRLATKACKNPTFSTIVPDVVSGFGC